MKSKKKLALRGRSLFKFEHGNEGGFDTIPTTVTVTTTTTGFSKDLPIKKERPSVARKQV